jgi:hypothetical protein
LSLRIVMCGSRIFSKLKQLCIPLVPGKKDLL